MVHVILRKMNSQFFFYFSLHTTYSYTYSLRIQKDFKNVTGKLNFAYLVYIEMLYNVVRNSKKSL